jgi:ElaB/YqjD/DUF883 family membrane-anchored ribosome-binding protein
VIGKYAPGWMNDNSVKNLATHNSSIIEQFRADEKRTVVTPSEADLKVIADASEKVIAEWSAKDPHNAQVLARAREALTQIRARR